MKYKKLIVKKITPLFLAASITLIPMLSVSAFEYQQPDNELEYQQPDNELEYQQPDIEKEWIGEYNPLGIDWDEFFSVDESQTFSTYGSKTMDNTFYGTSFDSPIDLFSPMALTTTYTESEPNNALSTANNLPLINNSKNDSVAFTGKISSSSDYDYIKIIPPRHGVLQVKLTPPTNTSLGLALYNSAGTLLAEQTGSNVVNRTILFVTTKKQTKDYFYIRVAPGSGSVNYSTASNYSVAFQYVNYYADLSWTYPFTSASGNNIVINSPVGYRDYDGQYHTGLDIDSSWNSSIVNITRGTILAKVSNGSTTSSVANYVVVKADSKDPITGNDIYIRYYHLNSVTSATGTILAGDYIGTVGNTGLSTSGQLQKHLHIDLNSIPSSDGPTIRSNPTKIINPIDFYNYSFTGTLY